MSTTISAPRPSRQQARLLDELLAEFDALDREERTIMDRDGWECADCSEVDVKRMKLKERLKKLRIDLKW